MSNEPDDLTHYMQKCSSLAARVAELERERDEARRALVQMAAAHDYSITAKRGGDSSPCICGAGMLAVHTPCCDETAQQIALARAAARKEE